MAKVQPKAKPDFNVFVVEEREGQDPFWLKVGAAWANKDGKGFNLVLQALPLDGRLVLREYKEPEKSWPWVDSSFHSPPLRRWLPITPTTSHHMSQFTPETTRNAVVETVRDRLARLESITRTVNPTEAETRLAIVILVAEILRDVDALVTEPLLQARKRKLNCQLSRIASCKDRDKLAAIIGAFSAEASRILPALCTFDPENPPW